MVKIKKIIEIAEEASNIAMSYYKKSINISIKSDKSPVTEADIKINNFLVRELYSLYPDIAVIAEENNEEENMASLSSDEFWLVDPIDGTKSFIDGSDEFSINISLIKNRRPVFGLIYNPVAKECYYNESNKVFKKDSQNNVVGISAQKDYTDGYIITASALSRNGIEEFTKDIKLKDFIPMASALKFGLMVEGRADIYPRFGQTMEWDTACGQAILEAIGGELVTLNGTPLLYGKEKFINPSFIAIANKDTKAKFIK